MSVSSQNTLPVKKTMALTTRPAKTLEGDDLAGRK
jgi:hypothetical protein